MWVKYWLMKGTLGSGLCFVCMWGGGESDPIGLWRCISSEICPKCSILLHQTTVQCNFGGFTLL
jgi:hypothetical protein